MVFNLAIILVFVIVVFAAFLASLVAILWYMRRRASQQRPVEKSGRASVHQNQELPAPQFSHKEKNEEELDESQAADILATWNILNPP